MKTIVTLVVLLVAISRIATCDSTATGRTVAGGASTLQEVTPEASPEASSASVSRGSGTGDTKTTIIEVNPHAGTQFALYNTSYTGNVDRGGHVPEGHPQFSEVMAFVIVAATDSTAAIHIALLPNSSAQGQLGCTVLASSDVEIQPDQPVDLGMRVGAPAGLIATYEQGNVTISTLNFVWYGGGQPVVFDNPDAYNPDTKQGGPKLDAAGIPIQPYRPYDLYCPAWGH